MESDSDEDHWDEVALDMVLHKSRRRRRREAAAKAAVEARWTRPRTRKKRKQEEAKRQPRNEDEAEGDLARWRLEPANSPWWKLVERAGVKDKGTRAYNKFRRKFRLPLVEVEKLVAEAQKVPKFKDKPAGPGNGRGPPRHPLLIKVLAALRCLGKGVDVEDVEDAAHISESCLREFVPAFIDWMAETVFPRVVTLPTGSHLQKTLGVFSQLGFPGAYCCTDGVHLHWSACPSKQHGLYNGKEGYPTLALNVSVLPSTEIIFVADWLPGSRNDKTQAQHDALFSLLREGSIEPGKTYYLYSADPDGTVIEVTGLYALVDGGYHCWRILQAPLTAAVADDAACWSERVESVRKCVECTFGILKKRFRILRRDFECQKPGQIFNTFKACCAMHNILLRHDRRDTMGHYEADWLDGYLARHRVETLEGDRAKHVVRGPRNLTGARSQLEPGHTVLREQLITHLAQATARAELRWLRTFESARPKMGWLDAEEAAGLEPAYRAGDGEHDNDVDFEDDDDEADVA